MKSWELTSTYGTSLGVALWVTEGKTNSEIAIILGSSARTVQKHLQRIFTKLNVQTRTAAAMRASEVWQETRRGGQ